jgi:CheY-like chemotaxis protein
MRLEEATVLVVDDEKDLRDIFGAWLCRKGCRVLTAANGLEALEVLDRERIDVLVSDIRMPVMGGVELVRTIYERKLPVPSIVFVSGYGDVDAREMYGLGVEALMEKPLSRNDFLRVLDHSLMERGQLWLTPSATPVTQSLALEMESTEDARGRCQFELGRGGCYFVSDRPLTEQTTIGLSIHFAKERLSLSATGQVRWFDKETSQTGLSFDYLAPECHAWVIAAIRDGAHPGFIPQCRWQPPESPSARDAIDALPETDPVPEPVT